MSEYLVYTILDPRPEDAPNLRRMWAIVRRQGGRLYDFRRRLAHDYWLARCAGKEADTPPGGVSAVAGSIAAKALEEAHRAGKTIEIPSLEIKIEGRGDSFLVKPEA